MDGPLPAPTAEELRLADARSGAADWRRWGPYLSERQWGTVREDYSADGTAWDYLPARSRAFARVSLGRRRHRRHLRRSHNCCVLPLALWNGHDPILKERLFGLTGTEGNHGEDVKEYYFYLDNVPDARVHEVCSTNIRSARFPYAGSGRDERGAAARDSEYELIDTGIFDDDRYFDVTVEYAKAATDDILMRVTRRPTADPSRLRLHLLPTLWFRNTLVVGSAERHKPRSARAAGGGDPAVVRAAHAELGTY